MVSGQLPDLKTVYSEEFHFIAFFPDEPKKYVEDIETSFGKASAHRWKLELPEVSYEILVAEFADQPAEMDDRSLTAFYKAACVQFGITCDGGYGYEFFDEIGTGGGFRTKDETVSYLMYLARKRFYLAKTVAKASAEELTREDRKEFIDRFGFVHEEPGEKGRDMKKLKWGLPEHASQKRVNN